MHKDNVSSQVKKFIEFMALIYYTINFAYLKKEGYQIQIWE